MSSQVQAVGIAWYLESDYEACLALFIDRALLPRTFLQWQDQAEQLRKRMLREGKMVIKAHIDPATFPAWCAANGCNVDANGRTKYSSAMAYKTLTEVNTQAKR